MNALRFTLACLCGALLLAGATVLPTLPADDSSPRALMGPPNGTSSTAGQVRAGNSDLSAVRDFGDLAINHVLHHVDYPQAPPVGGEHDPRWLECGVYGEPVREENAVHALEHGAVWITYDEELPGSEIERLAALLPDEGILSPHPGQTARVVVTAWATQLELIGADDPRLPMFLGRFGNGETAPEPLAGCHGGVERYEREDSTGA